MIIHHQKHVAGFVGAHTYWFLPYQILSSRISATSAAAAVIAGDVIFSLALGRSPDNKALLSLDMSDANITFALPLRTDPQLEVS